MTGSSRNDRFGLSPAVEGHTDDTESSPTCEVRPRQRDAIYGPVLLGCLAFLVFDPFEAREFSALIVLLAVYSLYPLLVGQRWFRVQDGELLIGRRQRVVGRFDLDAIEELGGDAVFRSYVWVRFRDGRTVFLGAGNGDRMSKMVELLSLHARRRTAETRSADPHEITIASTRFDGQLCARCGATATRAIPITARAGIHLVLASFVSSESIDVPSCERCGSRRTLVWIAIHLLPALVFVALAVAGAVGVPLLPSAGSATTAVVMLLVWGLVASNVGSHVVDRFGVGVWVRRWSDDRLRARLGFANDEVRSRLLGQ